MGRRKTLRSTRVSAMQYGHTFSQPVCMDKIFFRRIRPALASLLVVALMAGATLDHTHAETLTFTPALDTTIFQDAPGNSNGAGSVFIAGRAGGSGSPAPLRRALLEFDLSTLPQGTLVQSASLTLTLTQSSGASLVPFGFYRVLADWGAAGSIATSPGQGITAAAGDATWASRFAGSASLWTAAGGDYAPTASATTAVGMLAAGTPTPYTWLSTQQLVTDIQSWIDDPSSNVGWILIGDEGVPGTARQFASSENSNAIYLPTLTFVTAPIPEPSIGLLLVAGMGVVLVMARLNPARTGLPEDVI